MYVHVYMYIYVRVLGQYYLVLLSLSCTHRLVDESLQRVEKEQEAMEAVLVRMTSTAENGDRESSPDQFDV